VTGSATWNQWGNLTMSLIANAQTYGTLRAPTQHIDERKLGGGAGAKLMTGRRNSTLAGVYADQGAIGRWNQVGALNLTIAGSTSTGALHTTNHYKGLAHGSPSDCVSHSTQVCCVVACNGLLRDLSRSTTKLAPSPSVCIRFTPEGEGGE
jgi:hypothetical protein